MTDDTKAAEKPSKTTKAQMLSHVGETLDGVIGEYNANGIVETIAEFHGFIDVAQFAKEHAPKYWAIVRSHDVTPLV